MNSLQFFQYIILSIFQIFYTLSFFCHFVRMGGNHSTNKTSHQDLPTNDNTTKNTDTITDDNTTKNTDTITNDNVSAPATENSPATTQNVSLSDQEIKDLKEIEKHFHELIYHRCPSLSEYMDQHDDFQMPDLLENLKEKGFDKVWVPIPGMYGGFRYQILHRDDGQLYLTCQSWCRVVEGSEQTHEVTVEKFVQL